MFEKAKISGLTKITKNNAMKISILKTHYLLWAVTLTSNDPLGLIFYIPYNILTFRPNEKDFLVTKKAAIT
jgi:hypothetical protein